MWDTFKDLSFKFFRGPLSLDPLVSYFDSLKDDIQKANIPLSLNEYVYVMFFVTVFVFLLEFPLLSFITGLFFRNAFLSFLFSFTTSIFMSLVFFFVFYSYPSFVANRRKKQIDFALPFATTYMASVASSGAPPTTMFKVLGQFDEYGEISKEAKKIYSDTEAFGMNLIDSLRKTASRTPSTMLKELLWGLTTVLTAGTNPSSFLHEKSRGFMEENRRKLREFSQTLALLIEIYLTLIMVGSIFFIIMTSMMSIFGGSGTGLFITFLQFLDVFIILPFVSIAFILLLKMLAPSVS